MIHIAAVNLAYDLTEWLCAKHVAWWRKRGATVKVGAPVSFPCDRCPGPSMSVDDGWTP